MSRHSCICRLLAALLFSFLLVPAITAQQTTGGISGVVTDAQGGTLTGADVDVVGQETGLKRSQI
jgi:hypothetical protein